jgi:hypothetical protein
MAKNFIHMTCDRETRNLIMEKCVEEFLTHHPELKGYNITQAYILRQIAEYYLNN